jgi:hypothetical protein
MEYWDGAEFYGKVLITPKLPFSQYRKIVSTSKKYYLGWDKKNSALQCHMQLSLTIYSFCKLLFIIIENFNCDFLFFSFSFIFFQSWELSSGLQGC